MQTLVAVSESKNFREAAEKLGISAAAVSLKMRELESTEPAPLFTLEGKRKVLTHYGRALCDVARKGLESFDHDLTGLRRLYSAAEQLTIRIGGRAEALEHVLPKLDFPGRIALANATGPGAIEKLLDNEIDVAITHVRPDSTLLRAKKLFRSTADLIVHEKHLGRHGLASLTTDAQFLARTPCISYRRDGHLIAKWTKHAGVDFEDLKIRLIAEDWRSVECAVSEGLGYAVIPSYVTTRSPSVRRYALPEGVLPAHDFYAVSKIGLRKVTAFRTFLEFAAFAKR